MKCQVLDECVLHDKAQNTVIAVHMWKASTRGNDLEEFGLREEDINNARNGMFLTKGIEEALDNQQVCFLCDNLNNQLCLWVADSRILSETIKGSKPQKKLKMSTKTHCTSLPKTACLFGVSYLGMHS